MSGIVRLCEMVGGPLDGMHLLTEQQEVWFVHPVHSQGQVVAWKGVIPKGQKPPAPEGQSMVLYRATTKKRRNAVVYELVIQRTGSGASDAAPA